MLIILSPAKTLDMGSSENEEYTIPEFKSKAVTLNARLKKYSVDDLQKFMNISEKLAQENRLRYKHFKREHNLENSKQAVLTFSGDVYRGLEAEKLNNDDLEYAKDHLRILSGMYGLLRPMDLIQPYRLEMGRPLLTSKGKDLYEFWDGHICRSINRLIKEKGHTALVNLASKEYANAVRLDKIRVPVVDIDFREERGGELKFLSFNAKRARGLMARYIIKNRIQDVEELKGFDIDNYYFSPDHSSEKRLMFIR